MQEQPRVNSVVGAQLRAARALLNISATELAERTGLAINTIRRAEATNEVPAVTAANLILLITRFEDWGVVFIEADDLGPGVRLASATSTSLGRRRRITDAS